MVRAVRKLAAVGVDVNARTVESGDYCDDFGATPLHMAADSGALDVASALIDAGANMEAKDAQGRIPLDVAAERRYLDLVLLLLRKSRFTSLAAMSRDQDVAGSFTAADADERLLVEVASERYQLVSLVDEQGAETPLVALDLQSEYEGLCFDDETQTHTAVFVRSESARGSPLASKRAYYHYDADASRLVEAFVEGDAAPAPERWPAACQWREMHDWQAGLKAYERALGTLAPPSDDLVAGEAPKDLPVRAIPTAEVESALATLRGLPNVAVESVALEWPRWKLVVVKHADAYNPWAGRPGQEHGHGCAGFLLVWDETKQEWRSLFPCATVVGTETEPFSEDTLLLQHYRSSECGPQRSQPCLLRVDLATWQAQLYESPFAYMESRFEVVPVPGGVDGTENEAEQ